MKQTVITMLLMLVTMTAAAQEKDHKRLAENFFNAKVAELALRLDMTEEQKEKFIPIYRRYNDEMKSVMGPRKFGKHHPKDKKCDKKGEEGKTQQCDKERKPQLSDEEQLARTKEHMERQQKAQAIRLKYVDEFATVLTPKQVNRFFEVEKDITKSLAKRRGHFAGPHKCLDGKGPQNCPEGKGPHRHGKPEMPQK
jgi:Spy/CpxP family protein refolding chaperone